MSAKIDFRSALLLASVASLAACAGHTYGVSVTPSGGTGQAERYLSSEGFQRAQHQTDDVLSMERRHGDSVDHVRIFRGGPSPALASWSSASSGGVPQGGGIPYTAVVPSTSYPGSPGSPAGASGKLTIEIVTYRLNKDGTRHAVEPCATLFAQADSVITLVTLVPSAQRHQ